MFAFECVIAQRLYLSSPAVKRRLQLRFTTERLLEIGKQSELCLNTDSQLTRAAIPVKRSHLPTRMAKVGMKLCSIV